jgi:hypothetical protein
MGACKWQRIHVEDYASGNTFQGNTCIGTIWPQHIDGLRRGAREQNPNARAQLTRLSVLVTINNWLMRL